LIKTQSLLILNKKFALKYVLDRILACVLLALVSPFMLLGAFVIKLYGRLNQNEAGSIFYTEPRISAGKVFNIIKFRTVPSNIVDQIRNEREKRSITGSRVTTQAGRVILRWYLDELPQLFNIAKGDMSFVGPRPHIIDQHKQEIAAGLTYRNIIKAGLLGIPQACKKRPKYAALLEQMAKTHQATNKALNALDGIYAKKCLEKSTLEIIKFDIYIVVQGLVVVFRGTGPFKKRT